MWEYSSHSSYSIYNIVEPVFDSQLSRRPSLEVINIGIDFVIKWKITCRIKIGVEVASFTGSIVYAAGLDVKLGRKLLL